MPGTLTELEALPGEILRCKHVAKILCADVATIHEQALTAPETLGFPVICMGREVRIPKQPFLKFMRGEK